MNLTNQVLTRLDETIDFDWGRGSPASNIPDHEFSIRWVGYVQAPATGDYTFYTVTDDGVRLWVNDKLLVDEWRDLPREEHWGSIHLEAVGATPSAWSTSSITGMRRASCCGPVP